MKYTWRTPITTIRIPPALILFFLSPSIAELLSGSAPPAEFFNPVAFFLLASLYGSGAMICRELIVRWKNGWTSLLMLGGAYGIVEEGLMVKSFFDPGWMDLGVLGTYGRWASVNWVWAMMLTIYHAVFSIAIPILMVELMFPARRAYPWVSRRTFGLLVLLISAVTAVGFLWLTPYRPPAIPYLVALLLVIALGYGAWRLPHHPRDLVARREPPSYRRLIAFGFVATLCFFLVLYVGPLTIPSPILMILVTAGFVALVGRVVAYFESKGLGDMHRFALAAGALGFLILLAPLQELDKTRIDNPTGMGFVGLASLIFLIVLGYRIRHREHSATNQVPH